MKTICQDSGIEIETKDEAAKWKAIAEKFAWAATAILGNIQRMYDDNKRFEPIDRWEELLKIALAEYEKEKGAALKRLAKSITKHGFSSGPHIYFL